MDLTIQDLHDLNKHLISHRMEKVAELASSDFMSDEMTLEKARNIQNIQKIIHKTTKMEVIRKRDAEDVKQG